MTKLKQLKVNDVNIYPITHEDGVLDNKGKSIISKLNEHINNHPSGRSSSSEIVPRITSVSKNNEIYINKTKPAEFTVDGTITNITGNSFIVGDTTETDGGSITATVTKAGTMSLEITEKGTRYYLIRTRLNGQNESTAWLNSATTYNYKVDVGDTIELMFEDTATSWAGIFNGVEFNDLMWNSGIDICKINTTSIDAVKAFKSILAGDMHTLAHILYPEDFENN